MNVAIKRALTGIVAGIAVAISFTTKASADDMDPTQVEDTAIATPAVSESEHPAEAPTESPATVVENANSQAEQAQSGMQNSESVQQKSVEGTALQTVIESTDSSRNMAPSVTEEDSGAATLELDTEPSISESAIPMLLASADNDMPLPASGSLSVGGTALNDAENNTGWNNSTGWRYDGQSISMVNNNTAVDVRAEGKGVELSAAGFNRIGTLYADGDVNITGTGILLIDTIDMLEGTQLNLLTNTDIYEDGTGSVAVFAKQDDGSYLLINGSVNGVLDDTYSIPADVHLIIPENSCLEMRVLDCVKERRTDEAGNILDERVLHYGIQPDDDMLIGSEGVVSQPGETPYIYATRLEVNFPKLTIEDGATLTIAQNGVLNMGTTGYKKADADNIREVATLVIKGILEIFGRITGPSASFTMASGEVKEAAPSDLVPSVIFQGNGFAQGDGQFSYVDIEYKDTTPITNPGSAEVHTGDNCRVVVKSDCPTVYAEGKNLKIIYADDTSMGGIVLADQGNVSVNVYSVSGGKLNLLSEPVDPQNQLHMPESDIFVNGSLYRGNIEEARKNLYPDGWVFDVQKNKYSGGGGFFSTLLSESSHGGKYFYGKIDSITPCESLKFDASADETISFSTLHNALDPQGNSNEGYRIFYLKEYTAQSDDGEIQTPIYKIETILLNEKSTQTISRDSICGIEMMQYALYASVAPASGSIDTSKTNTGAGVLGGSNAGSLNGGAYMPVLSGSRTNKPAVDDSNTNDKADQTAPVDTPNQTTPVEIPVAPAETDNESDTLNGIDEKGDTGKALYLDVRVTGVGGGTHFTVSASLGQNRLQTLGGGSVQAAFHAEIPKAWNLNDLFAVFRNGDGTITAIKIFYDPITGVLTFETPILGEFDVICLHWDGDDYTNDAFRSAVEALLDCNR